MDGKSANFIQIYCPTLETSIQIRIKKTLKINFIPSEHALNKISIQNLRGEQFLSIW